ncbi:hypothetical protein BO83DRAFT_165688 [Aspergillus eucalypticola CBS 122712]|uniref:Uncharacterized protein n=1 Tax=Aspergillus eucalypticola (strain CBS 122712 / IBT 29274) TaxID=1448314 RepID=A0A317UR97_ASPEC|nr:uncharacterized protein BO83DRAFT_165688 [Aspergillus eucalypticola CBS 122712]PWY63087.1 hypothetical protein BO83DRAFT_165688 [Aspergillus eucalypticola CBS 122712]
MMAREPNRQPGFSRSRSKRGNPRRPMQQYTRPIRLTTQSRPSSSLHPPPPPGRLRLKDGHVFYFFSHAMSVHSSMAGPLFHSASSPCLNLSTPHKLFPTRPSLLAVAPRTLCLIEVKVASSFSPLDWWAMGLTAFHTVLLLWVGQRQLPPRADRMIGIVYGYFVLNLCGWVCGYACAS